MTIIRRYSEMVRFESFDERFDYLRLEGGVGRATFGFDRYINQTFYTSREWHDVRNHVIARDNGCNLGISGFDIYDSPLVHHMNPMVAEDIIHNSADILDPEFLVLTMHETHNAIHFGVKRLYPRVVTDRTPGDTSLW